MSPRKLLCAKKKLAKKKVILAPNDSGFKSHVNSKSLKLQERCQAYNKSDSRWLTDRHRQTMTMEADHEVLITDELTSTCWETCHVLPGIKGTSWPQASLRRTIMKRGVAPDHVPRIMMLTVLASLKVKLKKQIKNKQLNIGYIAGNSLTHVNTNRKEKKSCVMHKISYFLLSRIIIHNAALTSKWLTIF